jgi:molybdopterin-containing oxidoreductase family membrane subunit
MKHIDNMAKIILLTGTIVGYAYCMEFFMAYYGANPFELQTFKLRALHGPSVWYYYAMFFCNVFAPQVFWFKRFRQSLLAVFIVSMFVNAGMWYERYVIIVTTLERHLTPGSWRTFDATWVDNWTFIGTFGFFMMLFLLFLRFLPVIAIGEVKGVKPEADPHFGESHDKGIQEAAVMGETDSEILASQAGQKAAAAH